MTPKKFHQWEKLVIFKAFFKLKKFNNAVILDGTYMYLDILNFWNFQFSTKISIFGEHFFRLIMFFRVGRKLTPLLDWPKHFEIGFFFIFIFNKLYWKCITNHKVALQLKFGFRAETEWRTILSVDMRKY